MTDFLRELAVALFRILAWVLRTFLGKAPVQLYRLIWRITGKPLDACTLVWVTCCREGIDNARTLAKELLEQTKDASIAAMIGNCEIRFWDKKAARAWLDMAKQANLSNQDSLLRLELDTTNGDENEQVVKRILARNDLPPQLTREALSRRAWRLMGNGCWAEAGEIGKRFLDIQEDLDGRFICWTVAKATGAGGNLDIHLNKAREAVPEAVYYMLLGQCKQMLGDQRGACECIAESEELGFRYDIIDAPLGELARSQEYAEFKKEFTNEF